MRAIPATASFALEIMSLTTHDHDRDSAGMTYVYPVLSRRAGGISIGINLNPNNACNWRCVYCQVPGLVYGNAPRIDLGLLERELAAMLRDAGDPEWLARNVADGPRRVRDIALSGNGEPTSSKQLAQVLDIVACAVRNAHLPEPIHVVLITNGSLVHMAHVQEALARLRELGGEVWFKLDVATEVAAQRVNGNSAGLEKTEKNLALCAAACPTWVQTLAFDFDGPTLAGAELDAYCELLGRVIAGGAKLSGVLLYGLARPSRQPEAPRLSALGAEHLHGIAVTIRERTGLEVRVSE
jgi:wyosine [tRNA(Phe)-imidazoG37] synthetase (radical SAM superfamily)